MQTIICKIHFSPKAPARKSPESGRKDRAQIRSLSTLPEIGGRRKKQAGDREADALPARFFQKHGWVRKREKTKKSRFRIAGKNHPSLHISQYALSVTRKPAAAITPADCSALSCRNSGGIFALRYSAPAHTKPGSLSVLQKATVSVIVFRFFSIVAYSFPKVKRFREKHDRISVFKRLPESISLLAASHGAKNGAR